MDWNSFISNGNFLPWLIPVGPLLAFLIITLLTNRSHLIPATSEEYGGSHPEYGGMLVPVVTDTSRIVSAIVAMIGIVFAWIVSLIVVAHAFAIDHLGENVIASSGTWFDTGVSAFKMGILVDPLTTIMLIMVPLACTCIFIYSIGYMAHDPRQSRFFSMIALFAGAMLTLVVADNLLLLFIGWEVMGLCSYMLVGFWFEKETAYKAAIKAFMTTRVADVLMLLGIAYLYANTGTLTFRDIVHNPATLDALAHTPAILFGSFGWSAASLIGVFLVVGTIGKSAQFPLHVWLPDAMEGPTPVSAMIHAAAMVSAGIYMIIRMYPLLSAGADPVNGILSPPMVLMSVVGAFTALFAATIAVVQNDIKKVLAYSTISQLGFMMSALGIGAYIAAAFHLITHAFFKALLFMAAGSTIHGMEHGEHHVHEHHALLHGHDELAAAHHEIPAASPAHVEMIEEVTGEEPAAAIGDESGEGHPAEPTAHVEKQAEQPTKPGPVFDPQDMFNMGGLRKTMPVTFYTFLIGGLSLAGFPLITAGFWSKDEIFADAWHGTLLGFGASAFVFIMLALAAFLTAFYTMRQIGLSFWGDARTEEATHASLGKGIVAVTMTLPLIILAFFAVVAGFVGVSPQFPLFGAIFSSGGFAPFEHFLGATLLVEPEAVPFNLFPVLVSFAVSLGGLYAGYLLYWRKPLVAGEVDPMVNMLGDIYPVLKNKYYVDEVYGRVFVKPSQWFAANVAYQFIDKGIIDGLLSLIARVFTWIGDLLKNLNLWLIDGVGDGVPEIIGKFGGWIRWLQSGEVQQYMLYVAIAALVIGIIFALTTGVLHAAP